MTDDVRNSADRPSPVPWPPILIVATVVGALLLEAYLPLPWPGLDDWPARAIGIGFGVLGLLLIVWATATFARHQTTIMPHKAASALVTSGPFRRFRNPIYLGEVFIFLGIAELTKNVWFAILAPVFMGLITWLAILPEERHLESKFGDGYRAYKASTRRWI